MSAAQLTCSVEGVHTSSQHQRARSRHERVHGQVSCHLQSIQSITRELPPYDSLDVHVSQEHHEVALGPPLAGMCSTGPLRGALTAPHPGVGVGAVQAASKTPFHSVILGYDSVISSMTQTSSRDYWGSHIIQLMTTRRPILINSTHSNHEQPWHCLPHNPPSALTHLTPPPKPTATVSVCIHTITYALSVPGEYAHAPTVRPNSPALAEANKGAQCCPSLPGVVQPQTCVAGLWFGGVHQREGI
jgi:hypothetical protein